MTTPAPPEQGGGNFLTRKYGGIPGIVWLAGAAVAAYFLFFRNKSSASGGASSSGGGGTSTTGDISLQPGTETIQVQPSGNPTTVTNPAPAGDDDENPGGPGHNPNPQPSPVPPPKTKIQSVTYTNYTVKKGETLASIAKKYGISVATLAHANTYVPGEVPGDRKVGQRLGTGAGLKTGQILRIPHVKYSYA